MAGTANTHPITPSTLAGIDRALRIEAEILYRELRSGACGDAVDACWSRIDKLLEDRTMCVGMSH